jgi:hypothetical protein
MRKTVGRINPLPVGPAPGACPELRLFTVIGFNPGNYPVPDMRLKQASAAAVMGAGGDNYLFLAV